MSFDREQMKRAAGELAREGVFIGTSSWKYPGWRGQLYTDDRYLYRGKFAQSRFDRLCLGEYAEVFKTVCVDASYYKFPDAPFLESLTSQAPKEFLFAFKVTDHVTIKRFPNLPRFGALAGETNRRFLDAQLFESQFLKPCQPIQAQVGLLIFEFSHFSKSEFEHGRDFVQTLDAFLSNLPPGWRYGVEVRNRNLLHPDYFAMLAARGAAHVYSSWSGMPPIEEQLALPQSRTTPEFFGARLLLRPGRDYEQAVKLFSPYNAIKDPYPEGREAGARLVGQVRQNPGKTRGFIYVNNRFEGNALETIAGIVEAAERQTAA